MNQLEIFDDVRRAPGARAHRKTRSTTEAMKLLAAHLRESGEIEQAANVALLIHRADGQTAAQEGDVQLIVAKNRGGRKGTVTLRWYPSETRFADPPAMEPRQESFA